MWLLDRWEVLDRVLHTGRWIDLGRAPTDAEAEAALRALGEGSGRALRADAPTGEYREMRWNGSTDSFCKLRLVAVDSSAETAETLP